MNTLIQTTKSVLILGLIGGSFAANASADTFVREVSREFDAQPGQKLTIDVGSSQIEVRAGDSSQVVVEVLMSVKSDNEAKAEEIFDDTMLEFSEDPSGILVKTGTLKKKTKSWFGIKRSKLPKTKVIATCPPEFDLNLNTGSGGITIDGITGKLILDTGSGSISGSNLGGNVSADTGSGSVEIHNLVGKLIADTGSGGISVDGLTGTFSGDTGSGSIKASGQISKFFADTGSGSIHIDTSVSLTEDSSADTGSGSIKVQLPANSDFSFKGKTRSGSVDCAFPNVVITDKGKRHLHGSVGQNGPKLRLDAGSGDVRILPRD
jgi:DUF4097 and DUF4098 domain-containing protein YvlB